MILIWLSRYIPALRVSEIRELINYMLIGNPKYRFSKYVLPLLNGRMCSIIMINKLTKRSIPMYDCNCFYGNECTNYKYCVNYAKYKLNFRSSKLNNLIQPLQGCPLIENKESETPDTLIHSEIEYTLCRDCFLRPDINVTNSCICNNIQNVKIRKKIFNFADFKTSVVKYPYGFGYSYLKLNKLNVIIQMSYDLIQQQFINNINNSVLSIFNKLNKVRIYEDFEEFIDDGIYGHWELYNNGYIWMHTKVSGHIRSDYEGQYEYINNNCKIIWNNNYTNSYYVCNLANDNNQDYIVL